MEDKQFRKSDIITIVDVAMLVNQFYDKIRQDEFLAPVFNSVIKENWDAHLNRMIDFWSTMLLYTKAYKGDPMPKHLPLPIAKQHFDQWLLLFNETLNELFEGPIADNARKRAENIARIMMAVKEPTNNQGV